MVASLFGSQSRNVELQHGWAMCFFPNKLKRAENQSAGRRISRRVMLRASSVVIFGGLVAKTKKERQQPNVEHERSHTPKFGESLNFGVGWLVLVGRVRLAVGLCVRCADAYLPCYDPRRIIPVPDLCQSRSNHSLRSPKTILPRFPPKPKTPRRDHLYYAPPTGREGGAKPDSVAERVPVQVCSVHLIGLV